MQQSTFLLFFKVDERVGADVAVEMATGPLDEHDVICSRKIAIVRETDHFVENQGTHRRRPVTML